MPGYRKLGRPTGARMSMLRGQVTSLIVNGSIKTTKTRAKEVQRIAEKLITLAEKEKDITHRGSQSLAENWTVKAERFCDSYFKHGNVYDVVELKQDAYGPVISLPDSLPDAK